MIARRAWNRIRAIGLSLGTKALQPFIPRIEVPSKENIPSNESLRADVSVHTWQIDTLAKQRATLADQVDVLQKNLTVVQQQMSDALNRLKQHSQSIEWLAEPKSAAVVPSVPHFPKDHRPRISVIMPTWNRANMIERAIDSVRAQTFTDWELVIVDDGSTDETDEVIRRYEADPRIRIVRQEHGGESLARNRGLAESRGEIIAYLDTDNVAYPDKLQAAATAFDDPDCDTAYYPQLWKNCSSGSSWIFAKPFDFQELLRGNYIDMNAFTHRRSMYERFGGFDNSIRRVIDWDLALRYTAHKPAKLLGTLGGRYEIGDWLRLSMNGWHFPNEYLVRRKWLRPMEHPPRVLYVFRQFPHLSESHIETEIAAMQRFGVHVEMWSPTKPSTPFRSTYRIHDGTLSEAIRRCRPDAVHCHGFEMVETCRKEVARAGLAMTVRGDRVDFTPELVQELQDDPVIRAIYLFDHQIAECEPELGKVRRVSPAFDPEMYWPENKSDRRLVLRVGAGLPEKDYSFFIRVAKRCPRHRFVLALARCHQMVHVVDELIELNRSLGSPVEIRFDLPREEVATLMRSAGVYLHTSPADAKFTLPTSNVEALASGAYVLVRQTFFGNVCIGNPYQCYTDEDSAVEMIQATAYWNDERWLTEKSRATDRAYQSFVSIDAVRPILDDWIRLKAERALIVEEDEVRTAPREMACRSTTSDRLMAEGALQ